MRPFATKIRLAFVFGSVAKREVTTESDIDLLVVADGVRDADLRIQCTPHTLGLDAASWRTDISDGLLAELLRITSALSDKVAALGPIKALPPPADKKR